MNARPCPDFVPDDWERPILCEECGRDMRPGLHGCESNQAHVYGSEPVPDCFDDDERIRWIVADWPATCRSCAAPLGTFHHDGCCAAVCALCGDQWLGHECPDERNTMYGPHGTAKGYYADDGTWVDWDTVGYYTWPNGVWHELST